MCVEGARKEVVLSALLSASHPPPSLTLYTRACKSGGCITFTSVKSNYSVSRLLGALSLSRTPRRCCLAIPWVGTFLFSFGGGCLVGLYLLTTTNYYRGRDEENGRTP